MLDGNILVISTGTIIACGMVWWWGLGFWWVVWGGYSCGGWLDGDGYSGLGGCRFLALLWGVEGFFLPSLRVDWLVGRLVGLCVFWRSFGGCDLLCGGSEGISGELLECSLGFFSTCVPYIPETIEISLPWFYFFFCYAFLLI